MGRICTYLFFSSLCFLFDLNAFVGALSIISADKVQQWIQNSNDL